MIRLLKKPIKPCWYTLALVIILLALLVQLARLTVPHIHHLHAHIEAFASEKFDAQVRFGNIHASWPSLRPRVQVHNLTIDSNEHKPLIYVDYASMELDVLSSLFHWAPVWRKVEINGLDITVTQTQEGGWAIGQWAQKNRGVDWRYRSPSALFLVANQVDIASADVTFEFYNQ
ncbi:MAG: hypothetical protein AAFZ92_03040, partial [Pseudomonadota bacterium]